MHSDISENENRSWLASKFTKWYLNNRDYANAFYIVFVINIFVYWQRLTNNFLATDDYARFFDGTSNQAIAQGRWGASLINNLLFSSELHILPYFNSLLGVLFFSLSGVLTARIFNLQHKFHIVFIALLCSVSTFIAHNIFFITNVSAWITTFTGICATLLITKPSIGCKIAGTLLLCLSIATFQTIIQIFAFIIIGLWLLDISRIQNRNLLELCHKSLPHIKLICYGILAFLLSLCINYLVLKATGASSSGRFASATEWVGFIDLFERITNLYSISLKFSFFKIAFDVFYILTVVFLLVDVLVRGIRDKAAGRLFITLLFIVLFIPALNLPVLLGLSIPQRAYYPIGWGFAILYIISLQHNTRWVHSTVFVCMAASLLFTVLYINVFFYAASRQTEADIIRVNNIVTRIRMHPGYTAEEQPLSMRIVGTKKFSVTGWNTNQQALYLDWSKYPIFEHFTDLHFEPMPTNEFEQLKRNQRLNSDTVDEYPASNSILVFGNQVVLVLDKEKI